MKEPNIPLSPPDKSGWPWTTEPPDLPETLPDGSPWPRISIVTPSLNQGKFLEETIRSVLLQGYPNLEYIIIDGGSTDNSLEIIQKYEPWLAHWVSEPDRGQSHAINKGFAMATGDILAWINSDDYYAPDAFQKVAISAMANLDSMWFAGNCNTFRNGKTLYKRQKPTGKLVEWFNGSLYAQPSVFFRKSIWEKTNHIDETLHYSFDYDLWFQFAQHQPFAEWIDDELSNFRYHSESKTNTQQLKFIQEDWRIKEKYHQLFISDDQWIDICKRHDERVALSYLNPANLYQVNFIRQLFAPIIMAPRLLRGRKYYVGVVKLILNSLENIFSKNYN